MIRGLNKSTKDVDIYWIAVIQLGIVWDDSFLKS